MMRSRSTEPRARFARGRSRAPRVERHARRTASRPGWTRVVERALTTRSTQLVRRLDPELDPRLCTLIPDARNLLVVPLFLAGGFRLGVLVVEGAGGGDAIAGWTVEIIQQFASHAAVRLHNAWLLDDNRRKLEEIRRLQGRAHGAEPLAGVDGDRTHRGARRATRRAARIGRGTRTPVVAPAERAGGRAAPDRGGHPRRSAPAAGRGHDAPGSLPTGVA